LGALNREIEEELGIKKHFKEAPSPFLSRTFFKDPTACCGWVNPAPLLFQKWCWINTLGEQRLSLKLRCEQKVRDLLTITPINNQVQPCKTHYDIWYLVMTDGNNFNINPQEFHDTKWFI